MNRSKMDKYDLYLRAVQDPPAMSDFLEGVYRDVNRRAPKTLREDFSGAFALTCDWASRAADRHGIAVDNDPAPLKYGTQHYLARLDQADRKRVKVLKAYVQSPKLPHADIVASLNFSYGIFKTRPELMKYLKQVRSKLNPNGLVVLDCLGGIEISPQMSSTTQLEGFVYTWEQEDFNPLTREAKFAIHFQPDGERVRKRVFTYDWRMWTPLELREILADVGFKRTYLYWQGYGRCESVPDNSQAWVAYVVGRK